MWRVKSLKDNKLYAAKIISKSNQRKSDIENVKMEIDLLKQLDYITVVKFVEHFETNKSFAIIFELCQGDLKELLFKKELSTAEKIVYIRQVALTIQYLHQNNIVHRDIKPENFLICDGILKIDDFGFSKILEKDEIIRELVGTPYYISPEILMGQYYSFSPDIWSLGVLTYEWFEKQLPFRLTFLERGVRELYKKIIKLDYEISKETPKIVKNFIERLLVSQDERPSIDEVLEDPMFQPKIYQIKSELGVIEYTVMPETEGDVWIVVPNLSPKAFSTLDDAKKYLNDIEGSGTIIKDTLIL